ncbi:MAG TPA: DUF4278 domain-containing protein [Coleofasciculaceae cyanobacterium]|jgi:hypothetical protein
MKLTYRGINYQSQKIEVRPQQLQSAILLKKYCLANAQDANQNNLIRPIHYYTYRGVSYTKNLMFDTQTKLLLDIERQ